MTEDELQAIEARVNAGLTAAPNSDEWRAAGLQWPDDLALRGCWATDVPALVAEVRRLRGILKQIDSLYNTDRVAQPMAHQIEKLFDSVDDE